MNRFWALVRKDLLIEARTRELLTVMGVLALLLLVILNVTVGRDAAAVRPIAAGILWVVFAFAATLGIGRAFQAEKEHDQMAGLLLAPLDPGQIFLAKVAGNLATVLAVEAIALPAFAFLYNYPLAGRVVPLLPPLVLGTVGFVAAGTLFGAISVNTRLREALLPLLAFPVSTPALVAAVGATAKILEGQALEAAVPELQLLGAFAILFVTFGLLAFEYITEE